MLRTLVIVIWAALASCPAFAAGAARIEQVDVERDEAGGYRVQWRTTPAGAHVDVFVADRPDAPRSALKRLVADDADGEALVTPDTKTRPYFYVSTDTDDGVWSAERVLPLEGGRNFRDLGGYVTTQGQRVKWGKLYRSGSMAALTTNDYDYLGNLGIRVVCDLRTTSERQAEPNKWQEIAKLDYWTRDYETSFGELRKILGSDAVPTGAQAREAMLIAYRRLPFEQAPAYRELFTRLAAGDVPVAFNCSAGKDRAGTAAALILSLLDVPRETVVADYAISDKVVDFRRVFTEKSGGGPLASRPPEVVTAIMSSDPEYIRAGLAAVEARYGSVEGYVRKELGLTPEQIAAIRRQLLD